MIRSIYYSNGKLQEELSREAICAALKDPDGLLWVDFEGTPPESDEPFMREVFDFHPLAIDDALAESHVPKVDDWGNYLYIVLHAVVFDREARDGTYLDTQELDVFLGENYMVTHHDPQIEALDHVWGLIQRDERHLQKGPDYLLYRLADDIVASYMPVVEDIDDAVDQAEDQVFDRPTSRTLEQIFMLKRAALHLRRIVGPQREVLNKLARDDFEVIDDQARVYFRDVYDHLVRLHDITESIRDLVSGSLDTYLSVVNNRMNEIMKTLTIITALFMPISFLTGFFGMNFFQPVAETLKAWTTNPVFMMMMAVLLITPAAMFIWMGQRGWMESNGDQPDKKTKHPKRTNPQVKR
jgi:magnesium transporter